MSAPNGISITAGALNPQAQLILQGVSERVYKSRTEKSSSVVWQRTAGSGQDVESNFALPSFAGGATFTASGGIAVQLPEGEFKTEISKLASQPGMEYLNELNGRTDIDWQRIKLAHDHWDYKQEGLTGAGAAILSAVVAYMTMGAGTALVGNLGFATTTATGASTLSVAMTQAAVTSLASQASISLVNNKGNIGKTLKELGNSQTVKAALAAIATVGVMDKIGGTATMQGFSQAADWTLDKVTYNVINATGRSLTSAFITGGNLEDALKNGLIGGVVDTVHGGVAKKISAIETSTIEGYLLHKLAHGGAGCLAGAAVGGTCQDGAIGAAVGEMVAELMPAANGLVHSAAEKEKILLFSKLSAGAVAAYSGGDAQTAMTTAETAVQNNAFFIVPILIAALKMADTAWTAYDLANDLADLKSGATTWDELATNKGKDYVASLVVGSTFKRVGSHVLEAGIAWINKHPELKEKTNNVVMSVTGKDLVTSNHSSNTHIKTNDSISKNGYNFKPGVDLDLRGKNISTREAVDIAILNTGVPKDQFEVTQWGVNQYGKSIPVEYKVLSGPNRGAEVSIDVGHTNNGPGVAHVGWQTPGKKNTVGHIFLDSVSANRNSK